MSAPELDLWLAGVWAGLLQLPTVVAGGKAEVCPALNTAAALSGFRCEAVTRLHDQAGACHPGPGHLA